jgi:hypothetical protein
MQLFDETVNDVPVLFFDARLAPQAAGAFGVAGSLCDDDRLLVFADPVVALAATLGEQTQEVFGLEEIRRLGGRSGALDVISGPVHSQ